LVLFVSFYKEQVITPLICEQVQDLLPKAVNRMLFIAFFALMSLRLAELLVRLHCLLGIF